ncbi:hypothetical protein E2C01_022919 [Portunus trituberculatus]|uniref:Uncharacterized protein n=1 Tax=Portunus trituberculatus TaxID=210409 RepID=A0A5B7E9T1_PORTR|nr:hypothetical protein [Portunus trituberculatus]
MDGKKDIPPALSRTRFLEHYATQSDAIPVFTDGSNSDAALEWLYLLTKRGYRVLFCWVPGHVGVIGNEHADGLAKEAASRAPPSAPVPFRDVFQSIRLVIAARW